MSPNPLDDVSRGLQVIRDRLRQTAGGDPVDWVADQLRKPLPPLPLYELQAELDSLEAGFQEAGEIVFRSIRGGEARYRARKVGYREGLATGRIPVPGRYRDAVNPPKVGTAHDVSPGKDYL